MKSSKRIQKVAKKMASDLSGTVTVTFECNGKTDVADVEDLSDVSYEIHLDGVFGDEYEEGEIVKIEGLPLSDDGRGTSIEDLFYMVDFLNDRGYYALEAALDAGIYYSEMEEAYLGEYNSLDDIGREIVENSGVDIPDFIVYHIDYEGIAEDAGEYVKASNGRYYTFAE